ncbi:MAG: SPW repeat protein [Dongiaceae bacterium]
MAKFMQDKHAQDWINLVLALLLFVSPWVLGFSTEPNIAGNTWVSSVFVGVFAVGALSAFKEWEEWLSLIVGLWVAASPWVIGFATMTYVMWTHVVLGLLVAAVAAWDVWEVRHQPHAPA